MALRDQAKQRSGNGKSKSKLAVKAKTRKPSTPKMETIEPVAPVTVPPLRPNLPPSLPPALGFIASYARIPNLRKDRSSGT